MNLPLKIYKSSAGSGKTFTLVKEYLKICLPNPDKFKSIVAITFTKAAAAEMKDRILKALSDLSEKNAPDLERILLDEGIGPAQISNAPLLLEKILYNYSWFNIGTIDSFFHKIIRSFNKELDIPSDFEIYIETEEALDYAVDDFLYRSSALPEIHALLIDFIREKIANSQSWNIKDDLYRIAGELLKDNSLKIGETDVAVIREFIATLKNTVLTFETEMDRIAGRILKDLNDFGLEPEDLKNKKSGVMGFVLKSTRAVKDYEPGKRFTNGLTEPSEWFKKDDPNGRRIEEAMNTSLLELCVNLYEYYEAGIKTYRTAKELLKNIYTFAVYEELNKSLAAYRTNKNAVLIADFTKILARHIAKEEISFVYSRIGNRYDHYLIDEFQDTSRLQWQSLKPLVENAVSQGAECLLVGDSKQAIYRWRGGSVELIEKLISEADFPGFSEKITLRSNYRSSRTIVGFNNKFFDKVPELFPGSSEEYVLMAKIFEDVKQDIIKTGDSGYAEVIFIPKSGNTKETFREPARAKLLEQIRSALADGFGMGDIAVLVRDKKDAEEVARLLHEEKIPFITHDSLNLDHSLVVRLLLCLLAFVYDPENLLTRYEVLYLYQKHFRAGSPVVFDFLNAEHLDILFPEGFMDALPDLRKMSLYELLEKLILLFELTQADSYLQRFRDAVLEYSILEKGSIKEFLQWWDKGKFNVVLPENQDAIRITTIHKSKGLEFPVVLVPFADWDFNSGKPGIIWVAPQNEPFNTFDTLPVNFGSGLKNSELEQDFLKEEALTAIDNLNLLYVAFTRAKNRLCVNTVQMKKAPENGIKNISQVISMVLNEAGADVLRFEI